MANLVTIKVSEEKVRSTIDTLTAKIGKMEDYVSQLTANRERLEKNYTGKTASKASEAFKIKEKEFQNSIEKYKKQKESLQKYLDLMNSEDGKALAFYEEQLKNTVDFFES